MIHGGNMKEIVKLKYSAKHDLYRLLLTEEELILVDALVKRVRLGTDRDTFKDAAYDLNCLFSEELGDSYGDDDIEIGATITQNPDGSIDTTIEAHESGGYW